MNRGVHIERDPQVARRSLSVSDLNRELQRYSSWPDVKTSRARRVEPDRQTRGRIVGQIGEERTLHLRKDQRKWLELIREAFFSAEVEAAFIDIPILQQESKWDVAKSRVERVHQYVEPEQLVFNLSWGEEVLRHFLFDEDLIPQSRGAISAKPFAPSAELTDYWVRGMSEHLKMSVSARGAADNLPKGTQEDIAAAFARRLMRVVSLLGYRQQNGIEDFSNFGSGGRFLMSVQYQFLDRFPIMPDETTGFLLRLYRELLVFLGGGGKISGPWGKLTLEGPNLRLKAEALVEVDEHRKAARVLE